MAAKPKTAPDVNAGMMTQEEARSAMSMEFGDALAQAASRFGIDPDTAEAIRREMRTPPRLELYREPYPGPMDAMKVVVAAIFYSADEKAGAVFAIRRASAFVDDAFEKLKPPDSRPDTED